MIITDLDDFCENRASLEALILLDEIRAEVPTFKATLFTIPGLTSPQFITWIKQSRPWLDLVGHGWVHDTNTEAKTWIERLMKHVLELTIERGIVTRGWKAPGWQISDGCYQELLDRGYWCADQAYNDSRRPDGLRAYVIKDGTAYWGVAGKSLEIKMFSKLSPEPKSAQAIHGHIGHRGGHNANALELIYEQIIAAGRKDPDFQFIDEVMR